MRIWLLIALGGAAGAVARYGVSVLVGPRSLPLATLAVNLFGSLLLGLVLAMGGAGRLSQGAVSGLAIGFLGAFTTYSTFAWELLTLGRADRIATAAVYLAVSVSAGVFSAGLGYRLGIMLQDRL